MGEFEQLFGQSAPQEPQPITIDVTGQEGAALDAFCQCLAAMVSGTARGPAETLWSGLETINSVEIQIRSGLGLAASGLGWVAGFNDLSPVGRKLLSLRGRGQELHLQMDAAGKFFIGTWQNATETLTFTIDSGAGGAEFHAHYPVEFSLPLGAAVPGWNVALPFTDGPTQRAVPKAGPDPATVAAQPAPSPPPPAPAIPLATPALPPTRPVERVPATAAQGWFLTVRNGSLAGKKIVLAGSVRIGRGTQNDVPLPDDAASRNHAVVESTPAGCIVNDLGSTNGTTVNGVRISQPTLLNGGDVVVCGLTELVVEGPPKVQEPLGARTMILKRPEPPPIAAPPQGAPAEPGGVFCAFCGKQLVGAPKFCFHCGHQLH
jgi:hypothetical protein